MATNKARKRSPTLRLSQVKGYNDIKEELKSLNERLGDEVNKGHALYLHAEAFEKRLRDIEGKLPGLLNTEDLRKVNMAMSLLEKDAEGLKNESVKAWGMLGDHRGALADMKGKIADIASIIPSCLRDTATLRGRIDKIDERMNMAECDIEKLHDPQAFGPEPEQHVTQLDLVKALQSAKQRVSTHQDSTAVNAIIFCTLPGELRSRVFLAMYLAVSCIWQLSAEAPTVLTDNIICQLLSEWHDGMVTHKEDILLAFDVAIKKEAIRVR